MRSKLINKFNYNCLCCARIIIKTNIISSCKKNNNNIETGGNLDI